MNCNEDIRDKDDNNNEANWIRSNDELCSFLLSKESNPTEYKALDSTKIEKAILHSNDDTYDEFKMLAQEMAINPNLDKIFDTDRMIAAENNLIVSSESNSPFKDFKHSPHKYLSLQSTEGFYPMVASLKEDVNEIEFVTIIEKLLLSLAVEEHQKLVTQLISCVFLVSPNVAIFWISNTVKRYELEAVKKKSIDDYLLSFCPSEISPVLEILLPFGKQFSNDSEGQNLLEKVKRLLSDSTFFIRPTGAVVLFKSLEDVVNNMNLLNIEFEKDSIIVKMISPNDFEYIKCKSFSRKGDNLSKTMVSLKARGTSLTSLVQSSVCLYIRQPAILAVSAYVTYPIDDDLWNTPPGYLESTVENLFLLVASTYDKDILTSSGSIELPGGYIIVISPTQIESSKVVFGSNYPRVERLIYEEMLDQKPSLPLILS